MARLASLSHDEAGSDSAPIWLDLARVSLELGRVAEAIRAFSQAIARGAGAHAETEFAVLHALRGEPLRAAAELQAVIARNPAHAEARVQLASLLFADGRERAVLDVLEPPPPPGAVGEQWRALRSFALLRLGDATAARAVMPAARLADRPEILVMLQWLRLALQGGEARSAAWIADELAVLADDPGRARLEQRIEAHFQLGALFDQVPTPERAFRHWQAGHRLLAAAQPFSRNHHAALLQATRAAFGRERFAGPASCRADAMPVFIVGLPRSGTTLAEHILSAHPLIHGAGERMALLETVGRLAGSVLDPATPLRAATIDRDVLAAEAELYLETLRASAPVGASRIIDKMPANDMQLGFAAALTPGARIIHCTRDLRATGFSIFRRHLSGYHPYAHELGDLGWWMRAQRELMSYWRTTLPTAMLEIDLDDWKRDFKGTLRRVLVFLDLPYDPACETFHLQAREVRTASRDQVRRPVTSASRDRWRAYEAFLTPMLDEL